MRRSSWRAVKDSRASAVCRTKEFQDRALANGRYYGALGFSGASALGSKLPMPTGWGNNGERIWSFA